MLTAYLVRQIAGTSPSLEKNPQRGRKRNPLSQQHKILLGVGIAGAVGLGAYALSRGASAKAAKKTTPADGPTPSDGPTPGPTPSPRPSGPTPGGQYEDGKFDYVGDNDPWTETDPRWSKNGRPDQKAIAASMNIIGYGLGDWSSDPNFNFAASNAAVAAVRKFQNDWNAVVKKGNTPCPDSAGAAGSGCREAWNLYVGNTVPVPIGGLSDDGKIGPNTWKALKFALNRYMTGNWQGVVAAAKAHPFS